MSDKTSSRLKSLEHKHKLLDAKIKDMPHHYVYSDEIQKSKKTKLRLKEEIESIKADEKITN